MVHSLINKLQDIVLFGNEEIPINGSIIYYNQFNNVIVQENFYLLKTYDLNDIIYSIKFEDNKELNNESSASVNIPLSYKYGNRNTNKEATVNIKSFVSIIDNGRVLSIESKVVNSYLNTADDTKKETTIYNKSNNISINNKDNIIIVVLYPDSDNITPLVRVYDHNLVDDNILNEEDKLEELIANIKDFENDDCLYNNYFTKSSIKTKEITISETSNDDIKFMTSSDKQDSLQILENEELKDDESYINKITGIERRFNYSVDRTKRDEIYSINGIVFETHHTVFDSTSNMWIFDDNYKDSLPHLTNCIYNNNDIMKKIISLFCKIYDVYENIGNINIDAKVNEDKSTYYIFLNYENMYASAYIYNERILEFSYTNILDIDHSKHIRYIYDLSDNDDIDSFVIKEMISNYNNNKIRIYEYEDYSKYKYCLTIYNDNTVITYSSPELVITIIDGNVLKFNSPYYTKNEDVYIRDKFAVPVLISDNIKL